MKLNKTKRLFCSFLALIMLVSLFASCGSKQTSKLPDKLTLEHVYTTKYFDNSDKMLDLMNLSYYDGKLYGYANDWTQDEDGNGTSSSVVYAVNLEDNTISELFRIENKFERQEAKGWEENYSGYNILSDGTFLCTHQIYRYDSTDPNNYIYEENTELLRLNDKGEVLNSVNVKDVIPDAQYFYINRLVDIVGDNQYMIATQGNYYIFDYDFNLVKKITGSQNDWISGACLTGSGDVVLCVVSWDETAQKSASKFLKFDKVNKDFTELSYEVPYGVSELMNGPDSTFYYRTNSGISTFDITTGETAEVLNWLNSDINSGRISAITSIPDGKFYFQEYDRNYENRKTAILSPSSAGDVVEKYVINLAAVYLNDDLKDMMINFNKQNEEYRICFIDYSVYNTDENYMAGVEQLNNDIISGKIPDIIDMNGLDLDTYASKGILADLGKYMEEDESFDRSKYLENIFEACSYKGKLLSIIPSFSVSSYAGKKEIFGDVVTLTMEQLDQIRAKYPDAEVFQETTRSTLLNSFCSSGIKNYIDYDNATCNFDNPEFYRFLELVKSLPEEINYDDYSEEYWRLYENAFRDNRALLSSVYFGDYRQIVYQYNRFGGPISFVGLPVNEGCGSSIQPGMEIAVSANSPFAKVGWDFLKYVISEENQDLFVSWQFPILRSSLDKLAKKALENDDGGIIIDPRKYSTAIVAEAETVSASDDIVIDSDFDILPMPGGQEGEYKLDQSMIDKVNKLIETITNVERTRGEEYTEIYKILEEETGAFFASQKSAQDVAKIIQSRVQLFVQVRS